MWQYIYIYIYILKNNFKIFIFTYYIIFNIFRIFINFYVIDILYQNIHWYIFYISNIFIKLKYDIFTDIFIIDNSVIPCMIFLFFCFLTSSPVSTNYFFSNFPRSPLTSYFPKHPKDFLYLKDIFYLTQTTTHTYPSLLLIYLLFFSNTHSHFHSPIFFYLHYFFSF